MAIKSGRTTQPVKYVTQSMDGILLDGVYCIRSLRNRTNILWCTFYCSSFAPPDIRLTIDQQHSPAEPITTECSQQAPEKEVVNDDEND